MTIDKFKSYQLTQFIDENYPKEYLFSKREHEKLGYNRFSNKGKFYKVYTPELNSILLCKQLETLEGEIINGIFYISDYVEGYLEGQRFFEDNYKPNINTLYGENARQYVLDIHNNFFHTVHSFRYYSSTSNHEGWEFVKYQFPIIINGNVVREYGFFSGIVFEVEELIKKHYELFKSFDKCEHNIPIQQVGTKTEQKQPNKLSDLITHSNSIEIVENVKIQYRNIKGKRLKFLLMAFQELNLLPKERFAQKFHDCCKEEFDWDIASYNAMNGYKFNVHTDSTDFAEIKQHIETLIKPK